MAVDDRVRKPDSRLWGWVAVLAVVDLVAGFAMAWTPVGYVPALDDQVAASDGWWAVGVGVVLGALQALWRGWSALWAPTLAPVGLLVTGIYAFLTLESVLLLCGGAFAGALVVNLARWGGRAPWIGGVGTLGGLVLVVVIATQTTPV